MNKKIKNGCPVCGGDLKKGIYCDGFHCNKCDYDVHPVNNSCQECKQKELKLKEIEGRVGEAIKELDCIIAYSNSDLSDDPIRIYGDSVEKIKKILEPKNVN